MKNLSTLFLTDEGKYKFFDAAYQLRIRPAKFRVPSAELKDEYYINRFKAMLRNFILLMPRYFLEVSYKGTNYSGFQAQENANTIQAEVEKGV